MNGQVFESALINLIRVGNSHLGSEERLVFLYSTMRYQLETSGVMM